MGHGVAPRLGARAVRRLHPLRCLASGAPVLTDELGKLRKRCDVCGHPLTHPPGRGRPRRYCDVDCRRLAERERARRIYADTVPHRAIPI